MLSKKNKCRNFYDFAGDFHVGKAMKKLVISGLNPEIWQACRKKGKAEAYIDIRDRYVHW